MGKGKGGKAMGMGRGRGRGRGMGVGAEGRGMGWDSQLEVEEVGEVGFGYIPCNCKDMFFSRRHQFDNNPSFPILDNARPYP